MEKAFAFVEDLRNQQACIVINPGPRHWEIFCRLYKAADIKGNLIPDAFLAALAIESSSEWITADRDYHRFSGLRVRHPIN